MRKHRVLAGILAAVMLLGTMPAALAFSPQEDKASRNPDPIEYSNGVILGKTASALDGTRTTVTLRVSAPVEKKPVAVEFVLDGTQSLYPDKNSGGKDKTNIDTVATSIGSALQGKNAYVGITVFGRSAWSALDMQKVPSSPDLDPTTEDLDLSTEVIKELLQPEQLGTNVEAGLKKGMEELAKAPADATKYLVLVTDGGSYWWLDNSDKPANNVYGPDANHTTPLQNNEAAEGNYSKLATLDELGAAAKNLPRSGQTILTSTGEALSEAVRKVKAEPNLYTSLETGVYYAYKKLQEVNADKSIHLITVSKPYYDGAMKTLAGEFIAKAVEYSDASYSLTKQSMSEIADAIADDVNVAVPEGSTIVDYMGSATSPEKYDFNLVTGAQITLTIGGKTMTAKLENNRATFADGSYLVYSPDAADGEHFVLTLGQDLLRGQELSLSYTEELAVYDKSEGSHSVHTNAGAYLNDKDMPFPDPVLRYNVNSGGGGSSVLNTDDHYSYIIGYKDGFLKPYGTITRGEVATIFFRLLTDEARDKYWCQTNNYSDCNSDLWCNNAISTLSNMGIIDGFTDGTFRPYGKITRAQFAKIAVGFFETTTKEYQGYYSDVPENAWFTDYVEAASRVGLIQGFGDGTFRPNTNITRAQACVIVNRALNRKPDEEHLLPENQMITWPDNNPDDWFYADMQEATNSHDYTWLTVRGEPKAMEQWTKKLEQRDWAAFEHAWSTAHSAPGGEVVK